MNGKLENNVTPARGRARFRPGHSVHVYTRACVRVGVCTCACESSHASELP